MRTTKHLLALLAALCAAPLHAACPDVKTLDSIASMGSVFIGEMHGTNEGPEFVRCVVEHDVARGMHPTVALEQLSPARDLSWPGWAGTDGRSSKAMAQLVTWLVGQEEAGKLSIYWMLDSVISRNPTTPDQEDQYLGESLVPLVAKGVVIAYSGNAHAQKSQHMGFHVTPAGVQVASTMRHIDIESKGGGTAWACIGTCGVKTSPPSQSIRESGVLMEASRLGLDQLMGFDYVYAVPRFTASLPLIAASHSPATAGATPHP